MTSYHHLPLPQPRDIRLLRLQPSQDQSEVISCKIVIYPLREQDETAHLYEALSYVWGGPENARTIVVDDKVFSVTENLYAALCHLRDRFFERILWVDAICINQEDTREKENQIRFMAEIYSRANRVIVWLGEYADNSDRAFEDLRIAADDEQNVTRGERDEESILKLLQRPWFERIWVLQEVGVAQNILMKCGSREMNGYAFCSGLNRLQHFYEAHPHIHGLIRPVTYLIRKSIFRSRYKRRVPDKLSLGTLIDMYHTRKATQRHDKIYALLGMCREDPPAGLLPDYNLAWGVVLERVVHFLLHSVVPVNTWDDNDIAVIRSKGYIIGQVVSVVSSNTRFDEQNVDINLTNSTFLAGVTRWTLQASAKSVEKGDIVCHLSHCSNATIIRPNKDYFEVVMMIAEHLEGMSRNGIPSSKGPPRDLLLVWNWESNSKTSDTQEKATSSRFNTILPTFILAEMDSAARLYNVGMALQDVEEYEEATKRLEEAVEKEVDTSPKHHRYITAHKENLALLCQRNKHPRRAKEMFLEVIQEKSEIYGNGNPNTLRTISYLISVSLDRCPLSEGEREMARSLLYTVETNEQVPEEYIALCARALDAETFGLFYSAKRSQIRLTEKVIIDASANEQYGEEMLNLLFQQVGDNITITEESVQTALRNTEIAISTFMLLLDHAEDNFRVTEETLCMAVRNWRNGESILKILYNERAGDIHLTERVFKEAAVNERCGASIIALLLAKKQKVRITEAVYITAASNERNGKEIVSLLLEREEGQIWISDWTVRKLYSNRQSGTDIAMLLIDHLGRNVRFTEDAVAQFVEHFDVDVVAELMYKGNGLQVTEKILEAGVQNHKDGKNVFMLLIEKSHVKITEKVIKAAASNDDFGKSILDLLLDQRPDEFHVTESILVTAALHGREDKSLLWCLLDRKPESVRITEELLKAIVRSKHGAEHMLTILFEQRAQEVVITDEVVKAAAGNKYYGRGILKVLLDQRKNEIRITEDVLTVGMRYGWSSTRMMLLTLLNQSSDNVFITEDIVKAAVKNKYSARDVLISLFELKPDEVHITEPVLKAAVANESSGLEVLELLLDRKRDEVHITEGVLEAAAKNKFEGRDIMKSLIDRRGEFVIVTNGVLKAAAENDYESEDVLKLLLDHGGVNTYISEDVFEAVAKNRMCEQATLQLLLGYPRENEKITQRVMNAAVQNERGYDIVRWLINEKDHDFRITPEVIKLAVANTGQDAVSILNLLLRQCSSGFHITEDILEAVAGNAGNAEELMTFLLDQTGEGIHITEKVVQAAAGNTGRQADVLRTLYVRRRDEFHITEEIVRAIAGNKSHGKRMLAWLLREEDDLPITKDVVAAAAANKAGGKDVLNLLLREKEDKVRAHISEEILKIAAANEESGKDILDLLFDHNDDIYVTEAVVKAAALNQNHGKNMLRLLRSKKGGSLHVTEDRVNAAKNKSYDKLVSGIRSLEEDEDEDS